MTRPVRYHRAPQIASITMFPVLNIAAYKFVALTDLKAKRAQLLEQSKAWGLKGAILLSPEGINLFVAGETGPVQQLLDELRSWPGLGDLTPKISGTERQPFRRMLVRIKREIIAFGVEGIDPVEKPAPKLAARELKQWFDEGRRFTLLDTRNTYEVRLGTFKGARTVDIEHFKDFPEAVEKLPKQLKEEPVVVFCTGGIRCEKAGPFMQQRGFKNVWQLDGGILKYFEECGGAHYDGECFVFDQRTSLDPTLQETQWTQCFNCRTPLSAEDQAHPNYVAGQTCPYCFKTPAEHMAETLVRRHAQLERIIDPLPGSIPHDHFRPVNVPAECDGMTLLHTLCRIVPHVSVEQWRNRCDEGLLLDANGQSAGVDHIVRAGEQYRHRFPALIEPSVNMRVQILYEDDALIVLNKPAPLPMHAAGRFYRNTLKYVLDALYAPQKPRPSHRLDANTTGVLVAARTQYVASRIQPQFARGEVTKVYLVRVHGHPTEDAFVCDAPISVDSGPLGSRFIDAEGGLQARTEFRVLRRLADGTSLLEARPLTGRTNQIRVHLWHLGTPVCGDPAYVQGGRLGDAQTLDVNAPPLCLHAWRLTFFHPLRKEDVTFAAPLPAWAEGLEVE